MILILALPTLSAEITNLHIEVCPWSDKNFCLSQINYFFKVFRILCLHFADGTRCLALLHIPTRPQLTILWTKLYLKTMSMFSFKQNRLISLLLLHKIISFWQGYSIWCMSVDHLQIIMGNPLRALYRWNQTPQDSYSRNPNVVLNAFSNVLPNN